VDAPPGAQGDETVLQDPIVGHVLVCLVLAAGTISAIRGYRILTAHRGPGPVPESRRQRGIGWVVAGCMFLSIPGLVGYVGAPSDKDDQAAHAPL
jgi:hypothetical protein